MKILQVPIRFYPYIGGVENYVLNISKALVKRGHQVKVLCANEPKSDITKINGIEVERLSYICKIANTNISFLLPIKLLKEKFDIIHAHMPTPWSADFCSIVAKLKSKPLILSYYNDTSGKGLYKFVAKLYNWTALRVVLQSAHKILVLQKNYVDYSPYLRDYKGNIELLESGVDINRFKPKDTESNGNIIFFLSILDEFHRYKGLDYLLRAFPLIREKVPDAFLLIGGTGKLLGEYKKIASDIGVRSSIQFLGFIKDEDIVSYYNKCRVFVLPSIGHQEGFGMVLLEALACGKPVVTTDIVGLAEEIENNRIGVVVKPKDERALADAIIEVLENKDLSKQMGKRGRRIAEKYSWERIGERLETIYESACK